MIATSQDLAVMTEADWERLPEDGRWEVVEGRAILLPANDIEHQDVADALLELFRVKLRTLGYGYAVSIPNVRIPLQPDELGEIRSRVPDLVAARKRPHRFFPVGSPPDLVIEVLSTRRGNVERTEKLDDYARAGIGEYWIVNPFDRLVEVYRLRDGDYAPPETAAQKFRPAAFPDIEIDLAQIWAAID